VFYPGQQKKAEDDETDDFDDTLHPLNIVEDPGGLEWLRYRVNMLFHLRVTGLDVPEGMEIWADRP
jgi:hypothetical protein